MDFFHFWFNARLETQIIIIEYWLGEFCIM